MFITLNKISLSAILLLSLGISGCSHHFRNKPSIFLPTQNTIDGIVTNDKNTTIVPYCMDAKENILSISDINKTSHGKCDGYYIVDASKIITIEDNASKSNVVNSLLLISNDNCRRFIDHFKYNDFMGKSAFKLLSLNVFNIGINIGSFNELTTNELLQMQNTLQDNLKYRAKIREKINVDLEHNVSMPVLLNKIREYDHACGLLIKEETLVGDTNLSY